MLNSFLFNKNWTFSCKNKTRLSQILSFIFTNLLSLSINLVFLKFFIDLNINKYIAQIFAIGFSVFANFIGCKVFVFKKVSE